MIFLLLWFALCLSFHLLLDQVLELSQREELQAFACVPWAHIQPYTRGFPHPVEFVRAFQIPCSHSPVFFLSSSSSFFFYDSLIIHLFDPTCFTTLGSCLISRCPRLILTNALEIRLFIASKFWVRSNKNKFFEWCLLRNLPGNRKQSLGEDIYKSYNPWVNIQNI